MRKVFDHIIAHRWETLPPVDDDYLGTVKVLILPLEECVAKVNAALPADAPGEAIWSGVLPFALNAGTPVAVLGPQPQTPAALKAYARPQR